VDLTTAVAIIAALIGSAGLAGVLKVFVDGRQGAQKHDLDVVREAIDQLQEENRRLHEALTQVQMEGRQLKEAYEKEIDDWRERYYKQQCVIEDLQAQISGLNRSNKILRRELHKAQRNIADLVVENEELKKVIGGEPDEAEPSFSGNGRRCRDCPHLSIHTCTTRSTATRGGTRSRLLSNQANSATEEA